MGKYSQNEDDSSHDEDDVIVGEVDEGEQRSKETPRIRKEQMMHSSQVAGSFSYQSQSIAEEDLKS